MVILRLTHDVSVLEKLNFASLFLEIQDLPTVRLSWFLHQYIYFQQWKPFCRRVDGDPPWSTDRDEKDEEVK